MFITKPFVPRVYLVHIDGYRWEFNNVTDAALWIFDKSNTLFRLCNIRNIIGIDFRVHRSVISSRDPLYLYRANCEYSFSSYFYFSYIIRDEFNNKIGYYDILKLYQEAHPPKYRYRYIPRINYKTENDFRINPVPYTGNRPKRYKYYRKLKTTNEKKAAIYHEMDEDIKYHNVKIRTQRNSNNLPNSWDDYKRSDFRDRSWKRHRKHQWKNK